MHSDVERKTIMKKKIEGVNVEISEELLRKLKEIGVDAEADIKAALLERKEDGKRRTTKRMGKETD
jgi:Fe2+ transport system protein FeoA